MKYIYRNMVEEQIKLKKKQLAKTLEREAEQVKGYSSNFILSLSKDLAVYAVEIGRLEGELNVLNQLIGDEEK